MFNFNGPAMLAAAVCVGLILVLSLIFAFRDTSRGFREFFDLRVVRNFFRSILGFRPRYSLAFLVITTTVVPPLILVALHFTWPGLPVFALGLGYVLIVVCPLVYWFFIEAFGPGPRDRWRNVIDRKHPLDNESIRPENAASSTSKPRADR